MALEPCRVPKVNEAQYGATERCHGVKGTRSPFIAGAYAIGMNDSPLSGLGLGLRPRFPGLPLEQNRRSLSAKNPCYAIPRDAIKH